MQSLSRRSFLGAATAARARTAAEAAFSFRHPGLLHSKEDLDRMKAAVSAQESPVYDGYLTFAAHARSKSTYTIQNTGQITSWGRGPANFQNQAVADSAAAYQNALMWCVTGNRANADKARDILGVWSKSLTAITGADGPLGAGLQAFKPAPPSARPSPPMTASAGPPSPRERSPASATPPTTWASWSAPAVPWSTAPRDSAR